MLQYNIHEEVLMGNYAEPTLIDQEPQVFFADLLKEVGAGKVLDVACGQGGFTGILKDSLHDYTQIIGVDLSPETLAQARENLPDHSIHFEQHDAAALNLPDAEFDLVGCAFSLHHLPDPQRALDEIRRVLKPGGYLLIVEMYRDNLTDTQQTESLVHHWAAEIDTALGISHNQTFTRQQILEMVRPEEWAEVHLFDLADSSFDPKGEGISKHVLETIDRVLKKAEPLPAYPDFRQRAEALRQRVIEIGTHISTRLVMFAKK